MEGLRVRIFWGEEVGDTLLLGAPKFGSADGEEGDGNQLQLLEIHSNKEEMFVGRFGHHMTVITSKVGSQFWQRCF